MRDGVTKALIARLKTRIEPAAIPGTHNGRVIVKKTRMTFDPRFRAASYRDLSILWRTLSKDRIMNGIRTSVRAITMAVGVFINLMGSLINGRYLDNRYEYP
jgi:hypothetical protein